MKMNQQGNIVLFIAIAFLVIALLPPLIMNLVPAAGILIRIIMVFMIYGIVRGYLGGGIISLIITGILVYFLVIKYAELTASVIVFQFLLGIGFASVIIWGVGTRMR